jgi:uncharacterized repeat protein (TIGR01451 family)
MSLVPAVSAADPVDPFTQLHEGTGNPDLPTDVCHVADFGFAVDLSGSIDSSDNFIPEKNGVKAFVSAFDGAGGDGQYAGTRFNDTASTFTGGFVDLSTFEAAVDVLPIPGGYTATGAGITTADTNGTKRLSAAHVLFVVTDGSPNRPGGSTNDMSTWVTGANAAIDAANTARLNGWYVVPVYVGTPDGSIPLDFAGQTAWVTAVMTAIGGGSFAQLSDFTTLANGLFESLGCPPPTPGSITIVKNTVGGDGKFHFTGDGFGPPDGFDITTENTTGSQTFTDLAPGHYSVAESGLAGWDLTDATCTGQGNTPDSITLPEEGIVTCTFTNTKQQEPTGTITFVKHTDGGPADPEDFVLTWAGPNDSTGLASDGDKVTVPFGDYTVGENQTISGYSLTGVDCSPNTFDLTAKLDGIGLAVVTTDIAHVNSDFRDWTCTVSNHYTRTTIDTPGLDLTKGVSLDQAGPFVESITTTAGKTVWYQIVVKNTGQTNMGDLTIADSLGLPASCPVTPNPFNSGATWTCVYSRIAVVGTTVNTATTTGNGLKKNDSATVTVQAGGAVGGATHRPRVSPPNTTTLGSGNGSSGNGLPMVAAALIVLGLSVLLFTPRRAVARAIRRRR